MTVLRSVWIDESVPTFEKILNHLLHDGTSGGSTNGDEHMHTALLNQPRRLTSNSVRPPSPSQKNPHLVPKVTLISAMTRSMLASAASSYNSQAEASISTTQLDLVHHGFTERQPRNRA